MSRLIIALVMVALVAAGGVVALDSGTEQASANQTVTNESFSSDPGTVTLAESNRDVFYSNETSVFAVPNNTVVAAEIQPAGNYSFNSADGTLNVAPNSTLANASAARVTYSFDAPTDAQAVTNDAAGLVLGPLSQGIIIVIGLALVLSVLRVFS